MREHVGLVGGGFKPFTKGHFNLIQNALANNDRVILIVGMADRSRKGQFPIMWNDMEVVWKNFLEPSMPSGVEVRYVKSPVGEIYKILEGANADEQDMNTYTIYGDPTDTERYYTDQKLEKYAPRLQANDQIIRGQIDRGETGGISGTKMRAYLEGGDMNSFIDGLPAPVQQHGPEIFRILSKTNEE